MLLGGLLSMMGVSGLAGGLAAGLGVKRGTGVVVGPLPARLLRCLGCLVCFFSAALMIIPASSKKEV